MSQLKRFFPSLKYETILDSYFCIICSMAKQTRLPFPHSIMKSTKSLELLHIDVWEPYQFKSINNHNGLITIVDDFTRFTWIFLIKQKSEYPNIIKHFVFLVEKQFDTKVKTIKCDNAKEHTEGDASIFFYQQLDIFLHTSCSATPQQNGVVERKHRHLLEVAKALSFPSKLYISFWGDCLQCATFFD